MMANQESLRFGSYQPIARLEGLGSAELWHAWDPYLGRYVVIVSLAQVPAEEVRAALGDLGQALRRWTGVAVYAVEDVLHFSPGSDTATAFVALVPRQSNGGVASVGAAAAVPMLATSPMAWERLALIALALLAIPAMLFWLAARNPPAPPPPVAAFLPTATEPVPLCFTATPLPTETPTVVVAPVRAKAKTQAKAKAPAKAEGGSGVPAPIGPRAAVAPTPELPSGAILAEPGVGIQPGAVTAYGSGLLGMEQLVREWLLRHCHEVERAYQARGQNFACGWMAVRVDGTAPELTVHYTRIDRHMPTGRDLYTKKRVRLHCVGHCEALSEETSLAEVY